jgi:hypothetical protein
MQKLTGVKRQVLLTELLLLLGEFPATSSSAKLVQLPLDISLAVAPPRILNQ